MPVTWTPPEASALNCREFRGYMCGSEGTLQSGPHGERAGWLLLLW